MNSRQKLRQLPWSYLKICGRGLLAISFLLFTSCGPAVEMRIKPHGADSFSGIQRDEKQLLPIGFIKTVSNKRGDVEHGVNEWFLARVRNKMRETNLFYEIIFERPDPRIPYIVLSLSVVQTEDKKEGSNSLKAFAIGLTAFLLGPVLPLKGEYTNEMVLIATRWDGVTKTYSARSGGIATAYLSVQNYNTVWNDLVSSTISHCLNSPCFRWSKIKNSTEFL
jgi:hypothetical protein